MLYAVPAISDDELERHRNTPTKLMRLLMQQRDAIRRNNLTFEDDAVVQVT